MPSSAENSAIHIRTEAGREATADELPWYVDYRVGLNPPTSASTFPTFGPTPSLTPYPWSTQTATATPTQVETSPSSSFPPTPSEIPEGAKILYTIGYVYYQSKGSNTWIYAEANKFLQQGDSLRSEDGYALIDTGSQLVYLSPNSKMTVIESNSADTILGLDDGAIYISSSSSSTGLTVQTPHGKITDLGTEFEITVNDSGTTVRTYKGYTQVSDISGNNLVFLASGETTTIPVGGKPSDPSALNSSSVNDWWSIIEPSPSPSVPELPSSTVLGLTLLVTLSSLCSKHIISRKSSP
jgi:hypothetical protein